MSVGPLGVVGSLAGAPLAQTKGADVDRARLDAVRQESQASERAKADDAAGIAAADGEEKRAEDRDADGRRMWEFGQRRQDAQSPPHEPRQSVDPEGSRGGQLDLSG